MSRSNTAQLLSLAALSSFNSLLLTLLVCRMAAMSGTSGRHTSVSRHPSLHVCLGCERRGSASYSFPQLSTISGSPKYPGRAHHVLFPARRWGDCKNGLLNSVLWLESQSALSPLCLPSPNLSAPHLRHHPSAGQHLASFLLGPNRPSSEKYGEPSRQVVRWLRLQKPLLEPHFLPSPLGASECSVWSPWERGPLPYVQWAQACSSHNPALAGAALWPAGGATQPLPQAAKVGSLVATLHNSEPLSPPQFIPSRYTVAAFYLAPFSVLWHLGCFSIPPNPRGRFLRRLAFGAGLSAHLLSSCGIPGGSCQGSQVSGLGIPGCRAYGQGPVPLVMRPAVNMLTTATRARPPWA